MRFLKIVFTLLALPFFSEAQYAVKVNAYIDKYKEAAVSEMKRSGVPASITLAQGILESVAGTSALATQANNHFGIKCHEDWKGATFHWNDDAANECFRKYNSVADSYKDHSDFLKYKPRYASLFQLDINDYKGWAFGLKKCGYATNPTYAQELIKMIEDFSLMQFDYSPEQWAKVKDKFQSPVLIASNDSSATQNISIPVSSTKHPIEIFFDIKVIYAKEGDNPESIAKETEVDLPRLLKYNDAETGWKISAGDRIYLQPKHNHGAEDTHVVAEGETMWAVAQKFGIKLEDLFELNLMKPGEQPAAGETLNMKEARTTKPKLAAEKIQNEIKFVAPPVISPTVYVVKKGDTLYQIALQFHTTVDALKKENKLLSNTIYVGDKLTIPAK